MSNLWFNVRFGAYHWQLTNDWESKWIWNPIFAPENRKDGFKWFCVYCAFGKFYS